MAGSDPRLKLIEKVLKPYSQRVRKKGDPNYIGKNQQQWVNHNRQLAQELTGITDDVKAIDLLINREGYGSELDARLTLQELDRNLNRTGNPGILRQQRIGVPNASADEELSRLAMMMSNYNVTPGPTMGTDQFVTIGGQTYGIDSQMRFTGNGNLNLGVAYRAPFMSDNYASPKYESAKLVDFINEEMDRVQRRGGNPTEGKLLDTLEIEGYTPTQNYRDGDARKDAIISSHRPTRMNYVQRRDNAFGSFADGPYNPMKPAAIDIFDLGALRDQIMNERISTLREKGIDRVVGRGGSGEMRLSIPTSILNSLDSRFPQIDPFVKSNIIA